MKIDVTEQCVILTFAAAGLAHPPGQVSARASGSHWGVAPPGGDCHKGGHTPTAGTRRDRQYHTQETGTAQSMLQGKKKVIVLVVIWYYCKQFSSASTTVYLCGYFFMCGNWICVRMFVGGAEEPGGP